MGNFGRVRRAVSGDLPKLAELFQQAGENRDAQEPLDLWLDHGGALLLEDEEGQVLSAVRWREDGEGWQVDQVCTRAEAQGLGCDRWLLTKLEAGAIRRNIPYLLLDLPDGEHNDYYRRLGYTVEENGSGSYIACKRVGGVWQMREQERL